jgi:single-strand DNA-binding protein
MSAAVTLTGRLTRDPELRFTQGGKAIAKFSVVTSDRVRNKTTQEWEDMNTSFWDCTAFDSLAENVCEHFQKGALVIVVGKMKQENWEDKKTGDKRSAFRVQVWSAGPDLKFIPGQSKPAQRAVRNDDDIPF